MNYKLLLTLISFSAIAIYPAYAQPRIVELKPWNESDYPAEYSAKEIQGRIVDVNTGEPIEGAVVVAQWILRDIMRGRKDVSDRLNVLEAVTDKDGRFYIAGWGPKERPPLTYLENRDPEIWIFKLGYKSLSLLNIKKEFLEETLKINIEEIDSDKLDDLIRGITSEKRISTGAMRESIWNGKTIKLHKPKDEEEYWRFVRRFQAGIGWKGDETDWVSIKMAVREIEKVRQNKPDKHYLSTLPDNAREIIYGGEKP